MDEKREMEISALSLLEFPRASKQTFSLIVPAAKLSTNKLTVGTGYSHKYSCKLQDQ